MPSQAAHCGGDGGESQQKPPSLRFESQQRAPLPAAARNSKLGKADFSFFLIVVLRFRYPSSSPL